MKSDPERAAFVRTQTCVAEVPFVPEISIHAATELAPLWMATQAWLDVFDLQPPYWAFPWAGGQALARYVLDHPEVVNGLAVLDFASGSGIVGIASKLAGASRVTSVDLDAVACVAIQLNAENCGVELEVEGRDIVGTELEGFDVVLAGDVFYEREPARRFEAWLRSLASADKTILVGDPGRAYLPDDLLPVASYEVPVAFDIESTTTKATQVFRFPERPR